MDSAQITAMEEELFAGKPVALALHRALFAAARQLFPASELQVKKTQASFVEGRLYACTSTMRLGKQHEPAGEHVVLTLSSRCALDSPRIARQSEIRPGRWTCHIPISGEGEIDAELLAWLSASHELNVPKK